MSLDIQLALLLNSLAGRSPLGDAAIVFIAGDLSYLVPALFVGVVLFSSATVRAKIVTLGAAAAAAIIARFGVVELIRSFIHRPRPFIDLPVHQLLTSSEWSFPSGHTAFFFALATMVYLHHRTWGITFFILAIAIAIARVIAGIHYPSDIVGGAIIGSLVAGVVYALVHRRRAAV